jgi:small subunit ribosomal protein S1
LTEETNPPATEDEPPRATAEQDATEPNLDPAGAIQSPAPGAEAETEAASESVAGTATAATAVATEEPPAVEGEAPAANEPETAEATTTEAPASEAATEAAGTEEPEQAPALAEEPQGNGTAEPMTMAELLEQPDVEVKSLKHGDVVEGTVVRIDPDEILVDFGGKSEGVVSNRELIGRRGRDGDDSRPEIKVGDEVLVYVLQPESPEGHAVLSLRRAGLERKWRAMQERFESGEIVEARVIDHNKGGLIVDLGVRGFVPISQIVDFPRRPRDEQPRDAAQEIAEKLQPFVGRTLRLKILEVNRKANRLILSEKVALYEERREKRDELFSSLQVGQRVKGTVRSIAPFGVFIDLGGIDGLVHKSELSWNKVNNPETAYAIGDEVEAEVIDINHERGRISLSIRRLQPDPWQESVAKYKIGDVIEGTVTKLVNFGAFVRVEEGLEGLIHISELSNQRVAHPGDVVKEGEVLKLKIISLDSERHRLGLSLKQADDRAPAPAADGPSASQPSRFEDRPQRRERRDRRDRDYRAEDAISEPDEGIDNTMAAAFAESGLLDQFRANQAARDAESEPQVSSAESEKASAEEAPAEQVTAEAEPASAEAPAEPVTAEEVPAEPVTAEELPAEPVTAEAEETTDVVAEGEASDDATSGEATSESEAAAEQEADVEGEPSTAVDEPVEEKA